MLGYDPARTNAERSVAFCRDCTTVLGDLRQTDVCNSDARTVEERAGEEPLRRAH